MCSVHSIICSICTPENYRHIVFVLGIHPQKPTSNMSPKKGLFGVFLKWWVSPTTMGFPTKSDHFKVFWGTHHFRKHPISIGNTSEPTIDFQQNIRSFSRQQPNPGSSLGSSTAGTRCASRFRAQLSTTKSSSAKHLPGRINRDEWIFTEKLHEKLNPKEIPEEDFHGKIAWKLQEWHKLWFSTPMDVIWSWFQNFWSLHHSLEPESEITRFFMNAWPIFQPIIPTAAFLSSGLHHPISNPQPHVRFLFVGLVMFWGALNHPKVERGQNEIYPKNA